MEPLTKIMKLQNNIQSLQYIFILNGDDLDFKKRGY